MKPGDRVTATGRPARKGLGMYLSELVKDDGTVLIIVDLLGTPKSPAMTLEERYRVEDQQDGTFLHVDLTMTDP